ncbi:unnamed protein product [Echinostoma caproni]|uniref:Radical SAM protein n=1 Tax=Echinostoma caproni TaxID=27848 RepID=A0A183B3V5_9TREM|nr:unnamed protein product [Echinostoma caproni]
MNTGGPRILCDVYEADYRVMDPVKIFEKFTHFIESINRVRRLNPGARKLIRQVGLSRSIHDPLPPFVPTRAQSR